MPSPTNSEREQSEFLSNQLHSGWVENPRMNRSISCVEFDSDDKIEDNKISPTIDPTPAAPTPRVKSETIFGHVFSRGGGKRKDLKLNLEVANGRANNLRASKSNLDLSGGISSDTIAPDFHLFKKTFSKRTHSTISTTTTPTPNSETSSVFSSKKREHNKSKKKSKDSFISSSSSSKKHEINGNEMGPSIIITHNSSPPVTKIHEEFHNGTSSVGMEPSDLSDSSDSDQEFQAAEGMEELDSREIPVCPASHTEGREVINTAISCSIDQLFTMLFTSSKFYLDFHTSRKTFNIQQAPWEFGKDKKKTRQVSMTVSLNAVMGPKHSQITETQVMDTVSKPGLFYGIDCESVNAGVPYADTFYVTVHFCLSRISATETRFVAVADIKYRKSVWGITKSIIEKNAWAGLEEFYSHMERALKEECTKMTLGGSPIPSPKHEASLTRRRPPRNKGRAPPVPIGVTPSNKIGGGGGGMVTNEAPDATVRESTSVATTLPFASDSSLVLKIIVCILSALLLLNAFLYFKLNHLESSTTMSSLFPPPSFTLPGEMPQNHQDWLLLLQKQEALHRIELQKWHEILMSALKILHQAESDLEALKFHISSYSGGKYSVEMTKPEDPTSSHINIKSSDKSAMTGSDDTKTGEYFTKTFQEDIRAAEL